MGVCPTDYAPPKIWENPIKCSKFKIYQRWSCSQSSEKLIVLKLFSRKIYFPSTYLKNPFLEFSNIFRDCIVFPSICWILSVEKPRKLKNLQMI